MKAWREVCDDDHRREAEKHAGLTESDRHRRPPGNVAGIRREEGAVLWRFPAGGDECRSRGAPAALSEDAAATGSPALRQDFRSVRLYVPAFDRRAPDPRTAHA